MRKRSFLSAVMVGVLALGASSLSVAESAPIIVKGKFLNQTGPIATTTIFTPTESGLFRLSVYGTITVADPSSHSEWTFQSGLDG